MELIARFHSDITALAFPITVTLERRELGLLAAPIPFAALLTACCSG